jgi:ribosomal protein S18 acetylase RimI-like enzyme
MRGLDPRIHRSSKKMDCRVEPGNDDRNRGHAVSDHTSTSAITIRPLRAEDAAAWRALRLEALQKSPRAFIMSYEEAAKDDLAAFAAHIPPPESADVIFGAFADNALAGSTGFYVRPRLKERHKGTIWGVYVQPHLRGRSVARMLMQSAIAHARKHVAIVQLTAGAENAAARALYENFGFTVYGSERRAMRLDGREYDDVHLALYLDEQT